MKIEIQKTDEEIMRCFTVMKVLRPQLDEEDFLTKVRRQNKEGYQIAACLNASECSMRLGRIPNLRRLFP